MKSRLSKLLILTLVFTMLMPLSALAETSNTQEDLGIYADAVSRLGALEVLKGYPDGTFKPDNSITRAEFAAVAVRLLGLEDAATLSTGKTKFNDVPATHWASGYINIAVQQGVVNGYPDGTFKPGSQVTQAEALAMIIRVLGYEPIIDGSNWPTSYIVKSVELGLTNNVENVSANAPASRGTVALFSDNALTAPMLVQTKFGESPEYAPSYSKTILATNLKATKVSGLVTDVYALADSGLGENQVEVTKADGTTTNITLNGQDPFELLHKDIDAWYTGSKKTVVYLTSEAPGTLVTGPINNLDGTPGGVYSGYLATFNIGSGSTVYKLAVDSEIVSDYGTSSTLADGYQAKFYVNSKNEVIALHAVEYDDTNFELFKEIKDNKLVAKDGTTIDKLNDRDITFVKNGKLATAEDLEVNDVYYIFGDNQVVVAYDNAVSGTFTKLSGNTLTISGTSVSAADATSTSVSTDGGKTFTPGVNLVSQLGKDVTVLKGGNNKVVALYTTDVADADKYNYALYLGTTTNFVGNKVETYINVLTKDGSAWLKVNEKATLASGVIKGDILDLTVNSDGEITKTELLASDFAANTTITPDAKRSTLATVGAAGIKVVGDAVVFVENTNGSYSVKTWADVKNQADFLADEVYYEKDSTLTVGAFYVKSSEVAVEDSGKAGVVVGKYITNVNNTTVYNVEINENGTVNTYELADLAAYTPVAVQQFVTFDVTDGVATLDANNFDTTAAVITEVGNGYFVTAATKFYHEKVQVYDVRDDKTDAVTTAELAKGQTVSFIYHGTETNFVLYIVITE